MRFPALSSVRVLSKEMGHRDPVRFIQVPVSYAAKPQGEPAEPMRLPSQGGAVSMESESPP